jgi:hypothetical protein
MALAMMVAVLGVGPRIVRVENVGLLFTDNPAGVSGVDAGYSLPMGRQTLWLFGDVFLLQPTSPERRYVGGVSNTALITSARTAAGLRNYRFVTDPTSGLARPVIANGPGEGNETRLWPGGGWFDRTTGRVYLYYARIRTTGEGGPFGFRVIGHGLAVADTAEPARIAFRRLPGPGGSDIWWPASGPLMGCAVVYGTPERDPCLYVIGVAERSGMKTARLARVSRADIANPNAYEYLSGPGPDWSSDIARSADVEGLRDFPSELSVAYNRYLGGYLAVHSVGLSERLRFSLAPNPWGPYRTIGEIGAPHRAFEKAFCYAGKEHPELAEHNGRVVCVTYVDSQRYWLQLLRVTLER